MKTPSREGHNVTRDTTAISLSQDTFATIAGIGKFTSPTSTNCIFDLLSLIEYIRYFVSISLSLT